MASNIKAATPDTSFPAAGFLFGADSQAATDPSIYSRAGIVAALAPDIFEAAGYILTSMSTAAAATDNGAALTQDIIDAAGRIVVIPAGVYSFGGGSVTSTSVWEGAVDITLADAATVHLLFLSGAKLVINTAGERSTGLAFVFREGVKAVIDGCECDGGAIAEVFARTVDASATPGCELTVRNCTVYNFGWTTGASATTSMLGTIGVLASNSKRLVVENCQFSDFRSREDGTYGDQDGKSTFIQWFNASSGQQNPVSYSINNCEFDAGAEANEADDFDAIHILQQAPLANGNGVIHNCRFKFHGKSRRIFKYQGGGVHMITHCHVEPTATCVPSTTGQTSLTVTAATADTPGVFTIGSAHGIPHGTPVRLADMAGDDWGDINSIEYSVVPTSGTTFNLFGPTATPLDTTGFGTATANVGIVRRTSGQGQAVLIASAVAATGVFSTQYGGNANPHGFVTGDLIRFRNMAGGTWTSINEVDYYAEVLSATTFRIYPLSLLDTSTLGTYDTGTPGTITRINGVTEEGMAIVDWAGSNAGRLEISDCHFDGRGMRNGIVQTTGKGASVICRDSTIIGTRYDSNRFVPDSGANEVAAPTAFITAADDVDSSLINCDVYGWVRCMFLAGRNNRALRNRFFDPRSHWIQLNSTARDGLVLCDNEVISRTPYSLNPSADGTTVDFARFGEIRNWTNVQINRNTFRRDGNTLHGTRFIAFIVNGVTGEAIGNRVLPEGTGCHATNYTSGVAPVNSLTATATAGAATLNAMSGKITTESLTTAAGDTPYTLTITNDRIVAVDHVYVTVANGTNSAGIPMVGRVTPAAGSVSILIYNVHSANALNGTLVITFDVKKA